MNRHNNILQTTLFVLVLSLLGASPARAQFTDCSTGLLQMPTAEMQEDGMFMITNNFLNKHSLATSGWSYNTFQYGFYVSFWGRMEIGYVCTIFNGAWDPRPDKSYRETIIRNQDRHFTGRVMLLRENEFGWNWVPSLVVGASDPMTGAGGGNFLNFERVRGTANGYFNRYFIALTKHFPTRWGPLGVHTGYQYNFRLDYPINAPCAGLDWKPVWLTDKGILDSLDLILEFDSRTINCGFIASVWDNRFEAMFEVQGFRWINFGIRYKLRLKR